MFQIFYTLHIFNLLGIKHNDLHLENIFVILRKKIYFGSNFENLIENIYFNIIKIHIQFFQILDRC